jgi:hypothetical protein
VRALRQRVSIHAAACACALGLGLGAPRAQAHDTWFEPIGARSKTAVLALGTGTRFPVQELPIAVEQIRTSGCRGARLDPLRSTARALLLRVAPADAATPLSCWAQLIPLDVELTPYDAEIYLDDISAPARVREIWSAMHARGVPWKERFTKHARIELSGAGTTAPAEPTGMDFDLLLESDPGAVRPGDALVFLLLRDGRPQGGPDGHVRFEVPAPGRWVLRGTELRLSEARPDAWESRFVTLVFEIGTPALSQR